MIDPSDGAMNFAHQKRHFAVSIATCQDGIGETGSIYDMMEETLYRATKDGGAMINDDPLAMLKDSLKLEGAMLGLNHFWLCENRLVGEKVMQNLVKKVRGTRSYGSAALEFAYVAEGITDGYLTLSLAAWDFAAGIVIV